MDRYLCLLVERKSNENSEDFIERVNAEIHQKKILKITWFFKEIGMLESLAGRKELSGCIVEYMGDGSGYSRSPYFKNAKTKSITYGDAGMIRK